MTPLLKNSQDLILGQILRAIRDKKLLAAGDRLLLACSGGADSVFLAEAMLALRDELGAELAIAHIHHGLRGPFADRDAAFVKAYAEQRNVSFFQKSLSLKDATAPNGIEDLARRERYQALEQICNEKRFSKLLTAHHQDDQVETVLLRMIQGAQPRHWSGMESTRRLHSKSPVELVRPLLGIRRIQIVDWLRERGISYCEDETNSDDQFLRNRLRNRLKSLNDAERDSLEAVAVQTQKQAAQFQATSLKLRQYLVKTFVREWENSCVIETNKMPELPVFFLEAFYEPLLRRYGAKPTRGTIHAVIQLAGQSRTGAQVLDSTGVQVIRIREGLQINAAKTS